MDKVLGKERESEPQRKGERRGMRVRTRFVGEFIILSNKFKRFQKAKIDIVFFHSTFA